MDLKLLVAEIYAFSFFFPISFGAFSSGIANGGGFKGKSALDSEKFANNLGKGEQIRKKRKKLGKRGKIRKKRQKSGRLFHFTPPDR